MTPAQRHRELRHSCHRARPSLEGAPIGYNPNGNVGRVDIDGDFEIDFSKITKESAAEACKGVPYNSNTGAALATCQLTALRRLHEIQNRKTVWQKLKIAWSWLCGRVSKLFRRAR